ncbi:MAG: DMT family transporter [Puniceicoccales bacterium]|jgi:drug/metabolite transporter (DMT)-like permease|nr:DMT family transporter [Puniceicoccales bacterium]
MALLIFVSIIWGMTYGINSDAVRFIPPQWMSLFYVCTGFLIFFPFLLQSDCNGKRMQCMAIGAVQLGLMYFFYEWSFFFLPGGTVALLSVTTPIYIALIGDGIGRKFRPKYLAFATLIVTLTYFPMAKANGNFPHWQGILCSQLTNFCYALGQISYCKLHRKVAIGDRGAMAWHYLGALCILLPLTFIFPWQLAKSDGNLLRVSCELVFLGPICCGLGNYLWNKGICHAKASQILAFNNLPILLGIAFGAIFFHEPLGGIFRISSIVAVLFLCLSCHRFFPDQPS